jgi:MFS family permease
MGNDARPAKGASRLTMATLMLAVFTVSVGYGVVLPLLPYLIERLLGSGSTAAQVSRHTGLLTGVYTLALFLFSPLWGRASDWLGRRTVLLVGLFGFGLTMLVSAFVERLAWVYAVRFLSGLFAAAVTPIAAAAVADFVTKDAARARGLAFVSMAGIAGFLLGPMLSVFISRLAAGFFTTTQPSGSMLAPLVVTALLAACVGIAVACVIPRTMGGPRLNKAAIASVDGNVWVVPKLLALTLIVSTGIGVFQVGLALRGKQELGLTPLQIAVMYSECSLIMFAVQAIVFAPRLKPDLSRWFITPTLVVLAGGLFLVPWASNFGLMLAAVGAFAASAGALSPILTYWISSMAGSKQGWELGRQTAAASLGVTIGSAAGGFLFNVAAFPGASFILAAALVGVGFVLSLGLSHMLAPGNHAAVRDNTTSRNDPQSNAISGVDPS